MSPRGASPQTQVFGDTPVCPPPNWDQPLPETNHPMMGIPSLDGWFQAMADPNWAAGRLAYRQILGFEATRPLVTFALPIMDRYEGSPKRAIGLLCDWSARSEEHTSELQS